jgi:hypothetical protein
MKAALVVLLLGVVSAFAQEPSAIAAAEAACGPVDVHFDVHPAESQPLTQPQPSKSLVYVIEVFDRPGNQLSRPTLRVGFDGKWAGAVKGDSYLAFSVDPGEHHLCTNWQSRLKQFSSKAAFSSLNAEPGKTYYFRAHIIEGGGLSFSLDFAAMDPDEGKYLVASVAPSDSHAKAVNHKLRPAQDQSPAKGN